MSVSNPTANSVTDAAADKPAHQSTLTTVEKYRRYVNTSAVKGIEPLVISRAEGANVTTQDGQTFLDCFAGIAVVNAGHRNPEVLDAVRAQLEKLIHCCSYVYYVEPVADLAERLAQATPGALQKTFFCNSGAEAIEGAMRLARAASGKQEFIALQGSFHGRTNGTLTITGNAGRKKRGGPYGTGVAFAPAPYRYRCRYCQGASACTLACADAVEDAIQYGTAGNVAAFIAEPVMGEGGIIVPPDGYFARVKAILDQYGILFIADEVQSGFGRTGRLFAIEHAGVVPDIMAMAKGIADGFPLGAFIAPERIADSFQPGEHLSTFGGNPVSCAAGIANLDFMLREDLPGQAAQKGAWLLERLGELAERFPLIGEVRGRGLMIGVELVTDREAKTPAASQANRTRELLRERGVLIGVGGHYGNVLRIQPPLVIEQDQLETLLDALTEALEVISI
ncbi:MAG TPA: aspartate aminotransferase family protein [Ktedonobacterales bacterium]|nr:aspartate aminotransferase family protein [Ktedonobacterales bacterium]